MLKYEKNLFLHENGYKYCLNLFVIKFSKKKNKIQQKKKFKKIWLMPSKKITKKYKNHLINFFSYYLNL